MDAGGDSDSDSDYVPGEDDAASVESEKNTISHDIASTKRKRKADLAWSELCVEDQEYVDSKLSNSVLKICKPMCELPSRRLRSKLARFMRNWRSNMAGRKDRTQQLAGESGEDGASTTDLRKHLEEAVLRVKRKAVVVETRKFAGEVIEVQKVVSTAKVDQRVEKPVESGLDKALQALKGPKQISTVTKSAIDWDSFKEKEGISDDIAAAAKDGFRGRQDFLHACDYRNFELERDQRLQSQSTK